MENSSHDFASIVADLRHRCPSCSSRDEYNAHIAKEVIFPTVGRWGFDERFQRTLVLTPEQIEIYDAVKSKLRGKGAIIALLGERGLGKTSIAARIALDQAWRNYESSLQEVGRPVLAGTVIYRKAARIVARYKPLFADFGTTETDALLESLESICRNHEVLVIDELHDCDDLKMHSRVMTDLIDRRYAMLRDTILISNQSPRDFALSAGPSIVSRLREHGVVLECKWASFR